MLLPVPFKPACGAADSGLPLSLAEVILADRTGPGLLGGTWTNRLSPDDDEVKVFSSTDDDDVIDLCSIDDVIDFCSVDDVIDFCV